MSEDTEFHPAFNMPTTAHQAIEVIKAWGNPLTMTFHHAKSAKCAELIEAEFNKLRQEANVK